MRLMNGFLQASKMNIASRLLATVYYGWLSRNALLSLEELAEAAVLSGEFSELERLPDPHYVVELLGSLIIYSPIKEFTREQVESSGHGTEETEEGPDFGSDQADIASGDSTDTRNPQQPKSRQGDIASSQSHPSSSSSI